MRAHVKLMLGFWTLAAMVMAAIQTSAMKNVLENTYGTTAAFGAVYTTAAGGTAGTEPSGGSPAYARKALTWSGNAPKTATGVFDIPSGSTIVSAGVHSAVTAGTYYDGTSVTSQAFASQGTYTVTFSFTES